jgi:hypothetical protein
MKLLKCLLCREEMEIVGNERSVNKKVRCLGCGYTNVGEIVSDSRRGPEVVIMHKRPFKPQE